MDSPPLTSATRTVPSLFSPLSCSETESLFFFAEEVGFSFSPLFFHLKGASMSRNRKRSLFYVLGLTGSIKILKFLGKKGKARYSEIQTLDINVHAQNDRLFQLLKLDLISHHLVQEKKRREWYELTDKGKKALQLILELEELTKDQ